MRLLTKATLYFLTAMITLLAVAGFYLFDQFSKELNDRSDKELIADEAGWIQYLETGTENGTTFILRSRELSIYPTDAPVNPYPLITDAGDYTKQLNDKIPYRQLSQVVSVNGIAYQVTIKKSQEQKAALVTNFTRIILFVFVGLFLATIIFNWAISRRLWAPFKRSMQKIRAAELQKMAAIHFETTNTKEFNELNASLNYMTGKIYNDYVNMKEFTEDAAHEMQTPIAVVQSKLELLLQDSNLNEEQAGSVLQATNALTRLSKLNQGLLLLAKIENNQYKTNDQISLAEISKKYLSLFSEFIKDKQLIIETRFEEDCIAQLHPLLADSLITNLLGNAVKYNYTGGSIRIITTKNSYHISNTSLLAPIPPVKLFKRFNTSKDSEETSNGLGLAIVKKIADTNNLGISYYAENGVNNFDIRKI
ncbi:MAG: histidine kinase dimerization/phospho-acceptor domain-containing protein [Ginsengibacter sp.]